mgnify:CR=1 FL=1
MENNQFSPCGLCKVEVKCSEWEEHIKTEEHLIKEDDFFDNPDEAIDTIMKDYKIDSKIQAISVFNILRNIHGV